MAKEILIVTYTSPEGVEQSSHIARNKHVLGGRRDTTRRENRQIAAVLLDAVPGNFPQSGVKVTRTYQSTDLEVVDGKLQKVPVTKVDSVNGWEKGVQRSFNRQIHHLNHMRTAGFFGPQLEQMWDKARSRGKKVAKANQKRRGDDPFWTWGRMKAKFIAWNPVTSANTITKALSAGLAYEKGRPYLTPGLGKDTRELTDQLAPGKSMSEYVYFFSGLLGRLQDRQWDVPNIVHGVGSTFVEIIDRWQSGLTGLALARAEEQIHGLREVINAVLLTEALTSRDVGSSKLSLLSYTATDSRVLADKVSKKTNSSQSPAEEQTESANQHLGSEDSQLAMSNAGSVLRQTAAENFTPKGLKRKGKIALVRQRHRFFWAPPSVVGTQLDLRSERQDEIVIAFLRDMFTNNESAQNLGPAYRHYRNTLATAFITANEMPRTKKEKDARAFASDIETAENNVVRELEKHVPPELMEIIKDGLDLIRRKRNELPAAYQQDIQNMRTHEANDSYRDYESFLFEVAHRNRSNEELSSNDRERWQQAFHSLMDSQDIERGAKQIVNTTSSVSRRAA